MPSHNSSGDIPIIIGSANIDPDMDSRHYPDGILSYVYGTHDTRGIDESGLHWIYRAWLSPEEYSMLQFPGILPMQIHRILDGVVKNPGKGEILPLDMPFWLKHAILTQEN